MALAVWLAASTDPPAEHLVCHPDDYRAAGLHRNGPVTLLAILPPRPTARAFSADVAPVDETYSRAALEPDPACPPGEIRIRR